MRSVCWSSRFNLVVDFPYSGQRGYYLRDSQTLGLCFNAPGQDYAPHRLHNNFNELRMKMLIAPQTILYETLQIVSADILAAIKLIYVFGFFRLNCSLRAILRQSTRCKLCISDKPPLNRISYFLTLLFT